MAPLLKKSTENPSISDGGNIQLNKSGINPWSRHTYVNDFKCN